LGKQASKRLMLDASALAGAVSASAEPGPFPEHEAPKRPSANVKMNETGHGFDVLVFLGSLENPTRILNFEVKTMEGGRVRLKGTNYGYQLSDTWKNQKIKLMKQSESQDVSRLGQLLDRNRLKIEDYILTFDPMDNSIIIMRVAI
jgi:hypothetical protein